MCPLRQFKKIPAEVYRIVERKKLPWDQYYDLNTYEIGKKKNFCRIISNDLFFRF